MDPAKSYVHPVEDFPFTYHYLIMIYVVKALARCCAKNSMPPRHQTLHTAKNHRRTKCKPTAIEAERQTPDCTHQMQTSRTCLVFGIFRQILVWFLFSRCCTWNLYTFVTVVESGERLYLLQCVPHTLTSGKGQRLNRPRGDPLRQLSRDAVLSVRVCVWVCEDSDIISLRRWGHRLMRSLTDPWERQCVSKQWEGTVV